MGEYLIVLSIGITVALFLFTDGCCVLVSHLEFKNNPWLFDRVRAADWWSNSWWCARK